MALDIEALVFDFDGVLADTEPQIWRVWANILAAHNFKLTWDDYCRFGRGVPDRQMLCSLRQLDSDPTLLTNLLKQFEAQKEITRSSSLQQSPIPERTVLMLRQLSGFQIGLVTSSRRGEVEPILHATGLDLCFDALVFAEDSTRHKPDPEPYVLVRDRLGISHGLAFEDSEAGLTSARTAGLTAVRVDDPHNLPEIVAAHIGTTPL
jgi:HAD superfamily hydrolase (TIGR01509 family)